MCCLGFGSFWGHVVVIVIVIVVVYMTYRKLVLRSQLWFGVTRAILPRGSCPVSQAKGKHISFTQLPRD